MSILFFLIIAILVLCTLLGFRKGLFGIVAGAFSLVFIIIFVITGSPVMENYLLTNTTIGDSIYESAGNYVRDKLTRTAERDIESLDRQNGVVEEKDGKDEEEQDEKEKSEEEQTGQNKREINGIEYELEEKSEDEAATPFIADLINKLVSDVGGEKNAAVSDTASSTGSGTTDTAFPPSITRSLRGSAQEAIDSVEGTKKSVTDAVAYAAAEKVRDYAVHGIAIVLTFVIASVIAFIILLIIRVILAGKGLMLQSHILGGFFGFFGGLLIAWVIMYLISCIGTTTSGMNLIADINNNVFLSWLYNNNLVYNILSAITGV